VADACAFQVASAHTHARFDDKKALQDFALSCAVVTFEFENVPDATVDFLTAHVPTAPNAQALSVAQDRLAEKNFIAELGIGTAPYVGVSDAGEASDAVTSLGAPVVMKTRRMGYDGKGQAVARTPFEAPGAFEALHGVPSIAEKFVDFEYEASIIGARARDGSFVAYDPPRNEHENHILRRSTVPSPLDAGQVREAADVALTIAEALDYIGVLAVELFVTREGKLLVNEIAPRVHNSGHWTIEACVTSQFEQHIRAIAGWPLGDVTRDFDAVMENIIGDEVNDWQTLAARPAGLHLYGKGQARPGRKMGHITRLISRRG
jgi:5-(carboxyamino)imidazole ribonucleotide synthase